MQAGFTKIQSNGNDFSVFESFSQDLHDPETLSIMFNDRRFGIGGDGMIVVSPDETGESDASLGVFRADGSTQDPSGCAVFCAAKLLWEQQLVGNTGMKIRMGGNILPVHALKNTSGSGIASVRCDYPMPSVVSEAEEFSVDGNREEKGEPWKKTKLRLFGAHEVIFFPNDPSRLGEFESVDLAKLAGSAGCAWNSMVELVYIENRRTLRVRMYRPGEGELRASALGAVVSTYAATLLGEIDENFEIPVAGRGGENRAKCDRSQSLLSVTGPVRSVFDGSIRV